MRTLDETDLEILRLLVEDARRPYSDIAEQVGVSPPTVSDRIDRLQELGVIQGFSVDIDRTTVSSGTELLIDIELDPTIDNRVADRFGAIEHVEHVFTTADCRLLVLATVSQDRVRDLITEAVDLELVRSYTVQLLTDRQWTPTVGSTDLALACDECSNTVSSDGVSTVIDDTRYHFCCPTCQATFEDRYTSLSESA
ncbi:AsnC family transcriptional regulator [Natrialbaceae archaeon A-CW2]|uniref:AsnC family transcriptional regulator n=1 Tax=Natronosalvus amylolyticus TaxID=2961994 RepID=UPI0020C93F0A|nr:AsnC family transcriptional regulator [Natronosalvus amylolyticus]